MHHGIEFVDLRAGSFPLGIVVDQVIKNITILLCEPNCR